MNINEIVDYLESNKGLMNDEQLECYENIIGMLRNQCFYYNKTDFSEVRASMEKYIYNIYLEIKALKSFYFLFFNIIVRRCFLMRDSNIKRVDTDTDSIVIKIDQMPIFDEMEYDLMDDKDFKKYILDIKKMVRSSIEYRNMVRFLRENMDMNKCSFYENVSNAETFKIKIELHHHPFTIEDIIRIVVKKKMVCEEDMDIEDVAYEVMNIHYNCLVGFIPLSETVHELVHNKYLFIPLDKVYGNWEQFYNMYFPYMDEGMIELVKENIERTKHYVESPEELAILNKRYVYVDTNELYDQYNPEEIIDNMENRITEIKTNMYKDRNKHVPKLIYPNRPKNNIF